MQMLDWAGTSSAWANQVAATNPGNSSSYLNFSLYKQSK
jgi:hypothetical protein